MVIRTGTAVTRGGVRAPSSTLARGVTGCGGCGMGQYEVGEYIVPGEFGGAQIPGGANTTWGSWLQQMGAGAMTILGQRYAVPQLEPGVVIQKPGEVIMRQAPGYPTPYGGIQAQVSSGGWVLAAAAVIGLVAIWAMAKR